MFKRDTPTQVETSKCINPLFINPYKLGGPGTHRQESPKSFIALAYKICKKKILRTIWFLITKRTKKEGKIHEKGTIGNFKNKKESWKT